jgi:hypothetical protein
MKMTSSGGCCAWRSSMSEAKGMVVAWCSGAMRSEKREVFCVELCISGIWRSWAAALG